ncbi:hypothetical protein AB4Y42_42665 [Paraburkholderia sp. EG286B]|uniref:hypothetical protein n=1 Tax=Paraburkholderia sp. EG286B TaxID=3237011 RepID=UPI0034D25B16
MHPNDHLAQELAHIRAMILQLEHLLSEDGSANSVPVMSPDYWRARINGVRGASGLPATLLDEAHVLLDRLDALRGESGNRSLSGNRIRTPDSPKSMNRRVTVRE